MYLYFAFSSYLSSASARINTFLLLELSTLHVLVTPSCVNDLVSKYVTNNKI